MKKNKMPIGRYMAVFACVWCFQGAACAQDVNFSNTKDMAIWYNPSLKTDRQNAIKLNYRNVNYQGLLAYNSIAAMLDMPLLSAEGKTMEHTGYFSASIGAASDKSNQGILNNTMGLVGLSFAVPIAGNETYLAAGFQGSYYRSQLSVANMTVFADQFDQYGPMQGMPSNDALAGGWSYNYWNLNAGLSVFSNSDNNKWYLGASMLHINRPYSGRVKNETSRLQPGWSVQGGYTYLTDNEDEVSFYTSLTWQSQAYRHLFSAAYLKSLPGINGGIGGGVGYRYNDAIVPSVQLKYHWMTISILYDINISAITTSGYKRTGLELATKLDF